MADDLLARARAAFVAQEDAADCGPACLAMLVRFYGGSEGRERLRALSGAGPDGTNLAGLHEAAEAVGLEPEALQASDDPAQALADLGGLGLPALLHVVLDGDRLHYVVCFGKARDAFVVADPGGEVRLLKPDALAAIWPSRVLMAVRPGRAFVRRAPEPRPNRSWLRGLVRPDLNVLALAAALGAVVALLSLTTAAFLATLVDKLLPQGRMLEIGVGLVVLALLLLGRAALAWVREWFLLAQGRDFNVRVIGGFLDRLVRLPQPFFDRRRTGDLVARMNDAQRLQRAVTLASGEAALDALVLLATAGFLLATAPLLGLVALVSIPLSALIAARWHRRILSAQRELMAAHGRTESYYVDTLQGMEAVKVAGAETPMAHRVREVFADYQQRTYELGRIGARVEAEAQVVAAALLLATLALGAAQVARGALSLGTFVGAVQLTTALLPAALRLALTNVQLQEARVAVERLHDVAGLDPEPEGMGEAADRSAPHPLSVGQPLERLEVEGLRFAFPGQPLLLSGLSFEVARGERVALLGESGSGKTTALRLLQRLYLPDGGTVRVNGSDWRSIPTAEWRSRLGVVPQQVRLFSGTLAENIALEEGAEEAVGAFCEGLGLTEVFEGLPLGYATPVGEGGVALSGGQQQFA
ncbi:MAG TPA: ABC transporter transmembrane domain-containing protein, partial [Rubricoccaceae bacterium]|nr:ABC transporter transmembrane domain-containing protein [Rubricoccaceae bacterium]